MSNQILLEDIAAGKGGFVVYGRDAGDVLGYPVAGAGDINGDGFDDMVFGAYRADGGGNATAEAGEIYVVFGRSGGVPASVEGQQIAAGNGGFVIYGRDSQDVAGYSVAAAGDINGDGFDDLLISASGADGAANAEADAGEVYLVFGRGDGFGEGVWLEDIAAGEGGFVIYGRDAGDRLGNWVVSAGDVNGDGLDDLLIGTGGGDGQDNQSADSGEAYVIFGQSSGFGASVDLEDIAAGTGGFVIYGPGAGDADGYWVGVGALGDVNGDGRDDIGIGLLGGDGPGDTRPDAGDVYVVFGRAEGFGASVNLADVAGGNGGFVLHGRDAGDRAGYTVTSVGDVNADGIDDFITSGRGADGSANTQPDAGEAYVVFGRAGGFPAAIDLEDVAAGNGGFVIYGRDAGDEFGNSSIGTGDIDGDGIADIVICATGGDGEGNARQNVGEVYVIFGRAGGFPARVDLEDVANGIGGLVIYSTALRPGWVEVGALGDVNGDGLRDLGIGAMSGDGPDDARTDSGEVYVLFGRPFGQLQPGSTAADSLVGGNGPDTLTGGDGDDTLTGGGGDDRLDGGAGVDEARFTGVRAGYSVTLNPDGSLRVADNDTTNGNEGTDTLLSIERVVFADGEFRSGTGSTGSDSIDLSGPGGGTAAGGSGDDVYVVDDPDDLPVERPGEGTDTVRASLDWTLGPGFEVLELTGTANLKGSGNGAANVLRGNSGDNTLDGAAGVDTLEGAEGNDTYIVDDPYDVVIERTGSSPGASPIGLGGRSAGEEEGSSSIGDVADALRSNASSFALPTGVESGTLLEGAGAGALAGNADANPVTGNSQSNLLSGAAGNDSLSGGGGNDVAVFSGVRSGYLVEKLANGVVRVTDTDPANGDDGIDRLTGVEALRFSDSIEGGFGKAIQRGTGGANALDLTAAGGQIGAGGAGNDVYRVNSTADAVVELGNGGRDRVEANVNWVLWDNVEDLRLTGGNAVSGWGNELGNRMEGNGAANQLKGYGGNDTLFGASGADRLDGGDGADLLRGGAGNDVLTGGAAIDTFLFDAALSGNKDTISDFVPGTDRLQLDNDVFTALGTLGALAPLQFVAGANLKAAQDADDRIVYDTSTGTLYYDADGKGGAAAVAFAVLSGSPSIAAGDILIGD